MSASGQIVRFTEAGWGLTVEVLVGVDAGLLRGGPAGRVDTRGDLGGIPLVLPVYQQGNGVLCLRGAAEPDGGALGGGRGDLDGSVVGDHALVDVDVVGVEVVGDVALLAGPGLEGLKLALGLAHVGVEVVEVAEVFGLGARVRVGGIEALVVLDVDEDAVLARLLEEGEVVLQQLCGGLRDHDVDLALDGVQGDGEMRGVRSEDGDGAAGLQGVNCGLVRVGVGLVVGGEGLEGNVQAIVDLGDILAKMLACPVS